MDKSFGTFLDNVFPEPLKERLKNVVVKTVVAGWLPVNPSGEWLVQHCSLEQQRKQMICVFVCIRVSGISIP